ncbi:MAG: DUF2652 domain-containing protein [Ignavibacterium sp.]|nr:MAG: DUF2652 domain-containing protein [Ignavibacterium sp.]
MESQALIFIPDISGYTKFVTETENKHSKHIITELLEAIINANTLKLEVSEIEGDAVLFYRKGEPPELSELLSQVKEMFLAFHTQIKIIQRDNVCQCGACRTSVDLTLKFITHFGTLDEITVQNHSKIMGSDVILAHRLMKNNINENEYLLLTQKYFSAQNIQSAVLEPWVSFQEHSESFEQFDIVKIQYTPLIKIREEVPDVSDVKKFDHSNLKPDTTIFIEAPINLVHEILIDNDAKLNYGTAIKEIRSDSQINRLNSSHTCVLEDFEIDFVTKSSEVKNKEIYFAEEGQMSIGVAFFTINRLEEEEKGTILSVKILPAKYTGQIPFLRKLTSRLVSRLIIVKLRKASEGNAKLLKDYCEKVAREREN